MAIPNPSDNANHVANAFSGAQLRQHRLSMDHGIRDLSHGLNTTNLAPPSVNVQRPSFPNPNQFRFSSSPVPTTVPSMFPEGQVEPVIEPPPQPNGTGSNSKRKKPEDAPVPSPERKRKATEDDTAHDGLEDGQDEGDGGVDEKDADFAMGAPKHWTNDEKTKFFNWLMAPDQDEHWNALRASKNACFRECAEQLFAGKKTMQSLKGAYERAFNVFKQIHAYEHFSRRMGPITVNMNSQAERLKEYERRLQAAKKAGCEVGNINARVIDHWHSGGWYDLFYRRWHGDPSGNKNRNGGAPGTIPSFDSLGMDDGDTDQQMNGVEETGPSGEPPGLALPPEVVHGNSQPAHESTPGPSRRNPGFPDLNSMPNHDLAQLTALTQTVMSTYVHLLQTQSEDVRLKVEYMKRREAREIEESRLRRETELRRQEREAAEWEHAKQAEKNKQRSALAAELLANPGVEGSVKMAAAEYLKRLFMD